MKTQREQLAKAAKLHEETDKLFEECGRLQRAHDKVIAVLHSRIDVLRSQMAMLLAIEIEEDTLEGKGK